MKTKDIFWYEEKIQDIKKRKRNLKMLMDPDLKKKIRKDLTKEKRSAKHAEKQTLKKYILIIMSRTKIKVIKGRNRYLSEAESVIKVTDDKSNDIRFTFDTQTKKLVMIDNITSLQHQMYGKNYIITYIEDLILFRDKQIDKILKDEYSNL